LDRGKKLGQEGDHLLVTSEFYNPLEMLNNGKRWMYIFMENAKGRMIDLAKATSLMLIQNGYVVTALTLKLHPRVVRGDHYFDYEKSDATVIAHDGVIRVDADFPPGTSERNPPENDIFDLLKKRGAKPATKELDIWDRAAELFPLPKRHELLPGEKETDGKSGGKKSDDDPDVRDYRYSDRWIE